MTVAESGLWLPSADAWRAYAAGSQVDHFAWWCAEHCVQWTDSFAGQPLVLDPFQVGFMGEALAVDALDFLVWQSVYLVLPRKNGKTFLLAAYALYRLDQDEGAPEVLLAASSDAQAGRMFKACEGFIRRSAYLRSRFVVRAHIGEIARSDGSGGLIQRMSSRGASTHGYSPSLVVCDELHTWTTPSLVALWEALSTGGDARENPQVFCISTAGKAESRETGLLGMALDGNERVGEVERRHGLTIARNPAASTLTFNYAAPDAKAADPSAAKAAQAKMAAAVEHHGAEHPVAVALAAELEAALEAVVAAVKPANPAPWKTAAKIRTAALKPDISAASFLQLHAGIWSSGREAFIPLDLWALAERADLRLPPGEGIYLGADGSRTYDCTVVAWAWNLPDGRTAVDARVWSVRSDAPHHELCAPGPDGQARIDYTRVGDFAAALETGAEHRGEIVQGHVVEGAYDPRYLDTTMDVLVGRLGSAFIAALEPSSRPYRDSITGFRRGVFEGTVVVVADQIIRQHVAAAVGNETEYGWTVAKRKVSRPIDAVPAMALAYHRARNPVAIEPFMMVG